MTARPIATYRMQFRNGVDFARGAEIAPYIANLGASHIYASPIFQAAPGSTHGYDVTDHSRFDESLGGLDGFVAMSDALQAAGLGLILDIVPNHMAASTHNPWWRDVLRHGRASRYADYFDIDWTGPNLVLPVLGKPYGEALEAGEFRLEQGPDGWSFRYYEHAFPLDPATTEGLDPATTVDRKTIHRLHEAQAWRLAYWRLARDGLTYRRFFEIADLVGVRVELKHVFDDVHRLLFEQIAADRVQGLRIDHVDGLADPMGYLTRLKAEAPGGPPIWVEKILARGEDLPAKWPVEGETGYAFANLAGAVLTNPAAFAPLTESYEAYVGERRDYDAMLAAAKAEILEQNLAAELDRLSALALAALADDPVGRDWGPDSVRRAVAGLMKALPVYRTYFAGAERAEDRRLLADAVATAATSFDDPAVLDAVAGLFDADHAGDANQAAAFRDRFQQTSGALMAKAVEDTLFYRYNRLIAANEVGGEPQHVGMAIADFHAAMAHRQATQPNGLNATATHDTKRGEDARMRIAAIAERPSDWAVAVRDFDRALGRLVGTLDAECRWLAYQALLGAWEDDPDLPARFRRFLQKAAREAKIHTSWVAQNEDYEAALAHFAEAALANAGFRRVFDTAAASFIRTGDAKSLAQLTLKLTAPGIPDIYQGTEGRDLSFVDPDNRRHVPFAAPGDGAPTLARAKDGMLRRLLRLRREMPGTFAGAYRALAAGERALAFARTGSEGSVLVAIDLSGLAAAPTDDRAWRDACVLDLGPASPPSVKVAVTST